MSKTYIPIKMWVQEPEKEAYSLSFEDEKMLKIGRGARKGVAVQLEDPKVGRVHAVINVTSKDASIMAMGSKTLVNGKAIKSKQKLDNEAEIQVGETTIVVYVAEGALAFQPPDQEVAPPIEAPPMDAAGAYEPQQAPHDHGTDVAGGFGQQSGGFQQAANQGFGQQAQGFQQAPQSGGFGQQTPAPEQAPQSGGFGQQSGGFQQASYGTPQQATASNDIYASSPSLSSPNEPSPFAVPPDVDDAYHPSRSELDAPEFEVTDEEIEEEQIVGSSPEFPQQTPPSSGGFGASQATPPPQSGGFGQQAPQTSGFGQQAQNFQQSPQAGGFGQQSGGFQQDANQGFGQQVQGFQQAQQAGGFGQQSGGFPSSQPMDSSGPQSSGYNLHPTHQSTTAVYGFYGPPPPALPMRFAPSLPMLLDVADRLGKEVWYEQEEIW